MHINFTDSLLGQEPKDEIKDTKAIVDTDNEVSKKRKRVQADNDQEQEKKAKKKEKKEKKDKKSKDSKKK
jgi:hypothetical protein